MQEYIFTIKVIVVPVISVNIVVRRGFRPQTDAGELTATP
jgi:hypothetical protein